MPKLRSQSMILCCSGEVLHLSYPRAGVAEPERRERLRYGLRSALKHGPAERRQQYYRQAFSRLSSDDRTFLKQARISLEELTLEQRFRRLADEWSRQTST